MKYPSFHRWLTGDLTPIFSSQFLQECVAILCLALAMMELARWWGSFAGLGMGWWGSPPVLLLISHSSGSPGNWLNGMPFLDICLWFLAPGSPLVTWSVWSILRRMSKQARLLSTPLTDVSCCFFPPSTTRWFCFLLSIWFLFFWLVSV